MSHYNGHLPFHGDSDILYRYDEGTAFLPVVQNKRLVPKHEKYNFMALDEDGFDLPPDWYATFSMSEVMKLSSF